MNKYAMFLLAALVAWSLAGVAAEEGEWRDLFNGENLDGWEKKGGKASYHVEDGAIVGVSAPNSDNTFLCTKDRFSDFELKFEFKASPTMNSGVQFRSNSMKAYKNHRVHGYQCELEQETQDRDWWCGIYDEARRGWLFPKKSDKKHCEEFGEEGKRLWKEGEWNEVRIRCEGDHIQTWLNGEPRTDFEDGMTDEGFIGLQVHGVGGKEEPLKVRWRNIKIRELDSK